MSNVKPEWISETEAAAMLGLTPATFRRYVKDANRCMGINYTSVNGRHFQYNKPDIEAYLIRNSTLSQTA